MSTSTNIREDVRLFGPHRYVGRIFSGTVVALSPYKRVLELESHDHKQALDLTYHMMPGKNSKERRRYFLRSLRSGDRVTVRAYELEVPGCVGFRLIDHSRNLPLEGQITIEQTTECDDVVIDSKPVRTISVEEALNLLSQNIWSGSRISHYEAYEAIVFGLQPERLVIVSQGYFGHDHTVLSGTAEAMSPLVRLRALRNSEVAMAA